VLGLIFAVVTFGSSLAASNPAAARRARQILQATCHAMVVGWRAL
jgi:hypothetical protein